MVSLYPLAYQLDVFLYCVVLFAVHRVLREQAYLTVGSLYALEVVAKTIRLKRNAKE